MLILFVFIINHTMSTLNKHAHRFLRPVYKNHKGFLLSPVYKYSKNIFVYTRNKCDTRLHY